MSEKPQYPPLRSPMVVDGQLTDPWARYFQYVVTPYFERLLNLEDMEILDWSNNRQKDHERRIAEMEKLLQELWQTNDKGFTKRFEDIENILQFVDGPKDATLLRKLDDLEALIFSVLIPHPQNTDTALGAVGAKNPPIDADKILYRDSTAADVLVTSTWTQIKAFLGLAITVGKTITCTQNTTLDEAVAMSSKATKVELTDWSASANPAGWAASPTTIVKYSKVGKQVRMYISITGTSNATSASITLPFPAASVGGAFTGMTSITDNSVKKTAPGNAYLLDSESTLNFQLDLSSAAFTNSGTKAIDCTFIYESA